MSETDYQRGWREGAEVMRKALAQAFLEHAGEVGQTIHRRAIWLERAEATKRLAGLRAPDDSAQPPDLARELAEVRAQLAAAERRANDLRDRMLSIRDGSGQPEAVYLLAKSAIDIDNRRLIEAKTRHTTNGGAHG